MKLNDRNWREFKVEKVFEIFNSTPYHKKYINSTNDNKESIPYITRTNKNNGLKEIVKRDFNFKVNQRDIIIFGAENATFFYQPFEHITGNKMYGMKNVKINKYTGLFIQQVLNNSTKGCGFSYGQGLTGTREKRRSVMLPVTRKDGNTPDWHFMEAYIKEQYQKKENEYKNYVNEIIKILVYKEIETLEEKEWKDFFINDLFYIKSGVRLTKANMTTGKRPFIGSIDSNNGITNFVSNTNNSLDRNVLGVNYNGSVCEVFYHPYECIFTDDVKHLSLKDIQGNKFIYLFFKQLIYNQKIKYSYGYKFNANRMERQIVLVPVNEYDKPDYEYMEQYIKNLMLKKYKQYANR